jgi:hypothetical protein
MLVLSTHPSSNLLGSLDQHKPWLIERVVPRSELHLAKHRCPPGLEALLWSVPVTLITGFNDQLCHLFKYTRVRTGRWPYTAATSVRLTLALWLYARA